MRYEFNKKQKIIMAIIGSMIIIAFLYYIYTKENSMVISTEENIIENTVGNLEENSQFPQLLFCYSKLCSAYSTYF